MRDDPKDLLFISHREKLYNFQGAGFGTQINQRSPLFFRNKLFLFISLVSKSEGSFFISTFLFWMISIIHSKSDIRLL